MYWLRPWSSKNRGEISAIVDFLGLKMPNFCGKYLQGMERASCGCKIFAGSICKLWKEQVADAKFLREASSGHRKGKM